MVISVSNNISEISINEFFHNTEISVLNICHEMEMYNVRYKYLNEADNDKKDSMFKKFVETIKQKAIELFNKIYHRILSMYNDFRIKKNSKIVKKVHPEDIIDNIRSTILEGGIIYDTNKKVNIDQTDFNTTENFVNYFEFKLREPGKCVYKDEAKEIKRIVQSSINSTASIKFINNEKKKILEEINKQYKDGSISVEEKTAKIKRLMNRYTAILKCHIKNNMIYLKAADNLIKSNQTLDYYDDPENRIKIPPYFKKVVEDKNYIAIFSHISSTIRNNFHNCKDSDMYVRYAEERIPDLFTKNVNEDDMKENVRETDKSKWNYTYLNKQLSYFTGGCGTREQYNHVKEVSKYIYKGKKFMDYYMENKDDMDKQIAASKKALEDIFKKWKNEDK